MHVYIDRFIVSEPNAMKQRNLNYLSEMFMMIEHRACPAVS